MRPSSVRVETGFAMPALLASLAILTLALMIAMPSWRYLVRDDKEQELIFRGRQISAAIGRFQRRNGNALPASFEQLVSGKYLRREYKDPMSPDGKWRIVRPGEVILARPTPTPGGATRPSPTPSPTPVFGSGVSGPIAGVASVSTETGLRTVNGAQQYNRWVFAPNVPFVMGGVSLPLSPRPGAANTAPSGATLKAPDIETSRISR